MTELSTRWPYTEKLVIHKSGNAYHFNKGIYNLKKQSIASHGYPVIWFRSKPRLLHRLIAKGYIPNPENKREVNHKNGVKTDLRIENLEWVTASENIKHSYDKLGRRSTLNQGKGSLFWDKAGKGSWCARFYKDHAIKSKRSKIKSVCEKWLEEMRNG